MKKIIIAILSGVVVTVGIISIIFNINADDMAPKISFDKGNMKYSINCKDSALLNGVKAVDKVDGDVTNSLEIENRTVIEKDKIEVVEYVACDNSGNITNEKIIFVDNKDDFEIYEYDKYNVDIDTLEYSIADTRYKGYLSMKLVANKKSKDEEKDLEKKNDGDTKEGESSTNKPEDMKAASSKDSDDKTEDIEMTKEPESTKEPDSTKEPKNTKEPKSTQKPTKEPTKKPTQKPTKEPTKEPTNTKPTIVLKTNDITVNRGASTTVYLNCIREITDDKDSSERLFRKVGMTRTLSLRVPGTYTQGLYVVDSDGNRSDVAVITVHVR